MTRALVAACAACAACALAGCLSEPARPGGGGDDDQPPPSTANRLHHRAEVGDLDGNQYDDLVLWGHDDSGGDGGDGVPTVWIYFGGQPLGSPATVALDFEEPESDTFSERPVWYEPLDASITDTDPAELLVVHARDLGPPGTNGARFSYVSRISGSASPAPAIVATTGMPPDRMIGGYVDGGADMFVRERLNGGQLEILYGDRDAVFFVAGGFSDRTRGGETVVPYTPDAAVNATYEQGLFVLPNPSAQQQDLLDFSTGYAFRTYDESDTVGNTLPLTDTQPIADNDDHLVRGAQFDSDTVDTIGTDRDDQYFTIVQVGAMDPVVYTLLGDGSNTLATGKTGGVADLAIADVGGLSTPDVVTLDGGILHIYVDVVLPDPGAGDPAAKPTGTVDAAIPDGYDLLAVGHFFDDTSPRQIYVIDRADLAKPMLCFELDAPGTTIAPCTGT